MTVEMKADCIAGRIASELDLTAAQTAALNGIKAEVVAKIRQEGPEREALMQKALELLKGENLSASSVKELLEKRDARMRSIEPFLAEKIAAFHRILTPEQRRMAAEKISMRMARCRR
jgi:Spy/CpxP family protein refolding chaperone